ncbi:MAG: trypsin-like serine protease [Archangiaceae bacterium]|nr:trypsin-like serine protease [Archangiaceae bacterium]
MKLSRTMFAITFAAGLSACGLGAPSAEPDALDNYAADLLNAPVDYRNKWSVGICSGALNSNPAAGPVGACLTEHSRCTGSLIGPNLVLTARHCVHELDFTNSTGFCDAHFTTTPLSSSPLRVTTDLSVALGHPTWVEVEKVLVSPVSNLSCAGDLVVLKLKRSIPRSVARPVRLDLRPLTANKPAQVAVVGRGVIAERFDPDTYEEAGITEGGMKRRVLKHIPFGCVSNTFGACVVPDIGEPFTLDTSYFSFGASVATGDSGSGVIRQRSFDDEEPLLIGVTNAGTADPITGKPNFGLGLRLDVHAAFLRGVLASHCGGGYAPPH